MPALTLPRVSQVYAWLVRPESTRSPDTYPTFPSTGFSFDPLSTLSFSQPRLEELAVPFTPELRHQHGIDVSCLPFSMSPVPLPEVVKSLTPSQTELPDSVTFDPKSVDFSMVRRLDTTPLVPRSHRALAVGFLSGPAPDIFDEI